jgi:hypothetical protein
MKNLLRKFLIRKSNIKYIKSLFIRDYKLIKNINFEYFKSKTRNEIYEKLEELFYFSLPRELVRHRRYFNSKNRGFGENAFHSMWFIIFNNIKPRNCLEIGVYRGQTLSLFAMISRYLNYDARCTGISPFDNSGDSISTYLEGIDYLEDTIKNHEYFNLKAPLLIRGYSTSKEAIKVIFSIKWDLIYIDGSHDYAIVKQDVENAINNLSDNGIIVMDDSSLFFEFEPKFGSFNGHPGPSIVAKEYLENGSLKLLFGVGHNNVFIKGTKIC